MACGLAMQAKMACLSGDRPEWQLAIGIGINSGDVIMGAMGSSQRMDYTVLGDAVNVAARLCALAGRGQVLVSSTTYDALDEAAHLAATPLTLQLKGKREPVLAYDVQHRAHVPDASDETGRDASGRQDGDN